MPILQVIGADSALLQLKRQGDPGMPSQVNRLVNCETANLERLWLRPNSSWLIDRVGGMGLENLGGSAGGGGNAPPLPQNLAANWGGCSTRR